MSMSTDRYNKAARDGYLDALKEATRKDLNAHDEDGMTPTLWAAFEGNLDALRLIVGRGGDPDKCDNYGNTALHFASARGHMNCVSFLSNFGVNFWSLDIDLHSPKDLAAINNKNEILTYLDTVMAKFEAKDKKKVKSLKEKAEKDAAKRVKEFDKLQKKASKNLEEEQKKLEKRREKLMRTASTDSQSTTNNNNNNKNSLDSNTNTITNLTNQTGFLSLRSDSSSSTNGKLLHATVGQSPKFSEIISKKGDGSCSHGHGGGSNGTSKLKLPSYTGVYKKIQQRKTLSGRTTSSEFTVGQIERDGKRSVRSLSGLQRDSEVMYVPKYEISENNPGKRGKISGLFADGDGGGGGDDDDDGTATTAANEQDPSGEAPPPRSFKSTESNVPPHSQVSIFERPGFGSVAFRHTSSLNSFQRQKHDEYEEDEEDEEGEEELVEFDEEEVEEETAPYRTNNGHQSHTSNNGSHSHQYGPWDEVDVPVSDNEDEGEDSGALELFLAAAGLQSYIPVFLREKMDLDALMEQTESHLEQHFGLETGPRKKLMQAIIDRREAIENPGEVYDSRL